MKFKNYIEVQSGIKDSANSPGTLDQVLTSTATGIAWVDPSTISAEAATLVVIECKNTSGATITKGTPVYQTGTVGATDVIEIAVADASDKNKMAAIGLLQTTLNDNGFGKVVITGELLNITTSPIDGVTPVTGDTIYVKPGGGLTLTKPTGVNFIQNVGLVGKVSSGNAGSITVSSIMRSNDVPTPLYIDHDNQRLGVGTTSPDVKLHVAGDNTAAAFSTVLKVESTADEGSVQDIHIYNQYDRDIGIKFETLGGENYIWQDSNSDDALIISTGGSNRTNNAALILEQDQDVIVPNGKLGIGTTSPSRLLSISNNDATTTPQLLITQNGTGDAVIGFNRPGYQGWAMGIDSSIGNNFEIHNSSGGVDSSSQLAITPSGNVGIGTTSPDVKLEVIDASPTDGVIADFVNSTNAGGTTAAIKLSNADSEACDVILGANRIGANFGSDFFISLSDGVDGTNQERFRITEAGNVGIGTSSPDAKFMVAGSNTSWLIKAESNNINDSGLYSDSSDNIDLYLRKASGEIGVLANPNGNSYFNGGNVGIGTTSPSTKLNISSASYNDHITLTRSTDELGISVSGGQLMFEGGVSPFNNNDKDLGRSDKYWRELFVYSVRSGGALQFKTNGNNERMRIDSTGNVGIGTTSPSRQLEVVSSSGIVAVLTSTTGGSYISMEDSATTSDSEVRFGAIGDNAIIKSGGTTALSLDTSQNATFAGQITTTQNQITTNIGTTSAIRLKPTSTANTTGKSSIFLGTSPVDNYGISLRGARLGSDGTPTFELATHSNSANGTVALSIDNSQNATFTGTVTASTFLGDLNGTINTATTGVTQTAGNNSTLIATTAYADAAAAAVPIGDYLPLAGGTLTGGLIGTSANFGEGVKSTDGFFNNVEGIRLLYPNGGSNNALGTSGTTGALKITLPQSWTSTMMRMTIKVYEYSESKSFTINCGGYNHSGSSAWINEFAYIESQSEVDRNFTVRFGYDSNNKCCIYIGELTSVWSYPKVFVTDFEAGFNNTVASNWQDGWVISMETTAFENVSQTRTNCQINNWKRNGQDVYYGSGTGNVGIGTSSPTYVLDVESAGTDSENLARFSSSGGVRAVINTDSDDDGSLSLYDKNDAVQVLIRSAGNSYFNGGNVGIGTTSPRGKLDIVGNTDDDTDFLTIQDNDTSAGSHRPSIRFRSDTAQIGQIVSLDNSMRFSVGTTEDSLLEITSAGNVGIGTTSPAEKLEVFGSVNNDDVAVFIRNNYDDNLSTSRPAAALLFGTASNNGYLRVYGAPADTAANHQMDLGSTATGSYLTFSPSGGERMRIDAAGNVGIGTTSPSRLLDVDGIQGWSLNNAEVAYMNPTLTGADFLLKNSSGTGVIRLDGRPNANSYFNTGGNVGIGTTSPSAKLEVSYTNTGIGAIIGNTTHNSQLQIYTAAAGKNSEIWFGDNDDADVGKIDYDHADNSMKFFTNTFERMRIASSGYVGIGYTSPNAKLAVNGDFGIQGQLFTNTGIAAATGSGVANGFAIPYRTGITTLSSNYNYIVRLTTTGTGTDSGSYYLVGYDVATAAFYTRMVSRGGSNSNHPQLAISGNTMVAYHTHASSYNIRWSCETIGTGDPDGTLHNMGADYQWQRDANNLYYNDGNVGIGTTSPSQLLDVGGDGLIQGKLTVGNATYYDQAGVLNVYGSGKNQLTIQASDNTLDRGIAFRNSGGAHVSYVAAINAGSSLADLVFGVSDNTETSVDDVEERMRITSAGNVGIGTTSPSTKLHVEGNVLIDAYNQGEDNGLFFREGFLTIDQPSITVWDMSNSGASPDGLSINSNDGIRFRENGGEVARFKDGSFGIGTTSPGAKLVVDGGNDNEIAKFLSTDDTAQIKISDNDTNAWFGVRNGVAFISQTGGTPASGIAVDSTGNVGIGTSSPSHKLEVGLTSSVALASQPAIPLMISNNGNLVDGRVLLQVKHDTVNTAGAIAAGYQMTAAAVTSGTASYYDSLIFLESAGSGSGTVHSAPKNIEFYVNNYNTAAGAGTSYTALGNLAFELQADGDAIFYDNVGIGTTSPGSKIHVNGTSERILIGDSSAGENWIDGQDLGGFAFKTHYNLQEKTGMYAVGMLYGSGSDYTPHLHFKTSSTTRLAIDNDGNVGIGTTSPDSIVDIVGNNPILTIRDSNTSTSTATSTIRFAESNANDTLGNYWDVGYSPVNLLNFDFNGSTKMTINSSGNVGIGTSSPSDKLHVNGTVRSQAPATSDWALLGYNSAGSAASGLWFDNGDGELLLRDDSGNLNVRLRSDTSSYINGGNLGLGTTSPAQKLTVNSGRMLVSNTTTPIYIKAGSTYKSWVHHIGGSDGYIFAPSTADNGETWDWANQTKLGANGVVTAKNFQLSSDERFKNNIKNIKDIKVEAAFKSFEMESSPGEKRYGVVAQELEKTNPELVETDHEGFKSVKYIDLLIAKIAELEARLEKLEK